MPNFPKPKKSYENTIKKQHSNSFFKGVTHEQPCCGGPLSCPVFVFFNKVIFSFPLL